MSSLTWSMDLPKEEHRRGGDPELALQFARRPQLEKRYEYFLRMAKLASKFFINPSTGQPNVSGLIMAEAAGFKTELSQLKRFDDRLRTKILNAVDVPHGGEDGFNRFLPADIWLEPIWSFR
ncbi:eukaryotic peptide chain release factor subunit 1-2-like [Punica granatum]|uniref:Eukaryotic peptide chain release factor subunit 1-2-like n=1 Tax=Punica granatum TaxID=22663 RepID=A0A6P8DRQ2_PUNGR|nr:eukaryotic peptide chain release factor subunit 1-2-like [Punica granatum]